MSGRQQQSGTTFASLPDGLDVRSVPATHRGVAAVYQPIVELATGRTVAYEALARFDPASGHAGPEAAFAAAAAAGPRASMELDHACISAAVDGAVRAALSPTTTLLLNVLPSTLQRTMPSSVADMVARAQRHGLRIMVEVTETDVMSRPAELLAFAERNRRRGFGLAVDDVGVNPESLSLLRLLRPDVIKLDRSIVTAPPTAETGRVLGAVLATAEATGASVLAEGIETDRDAHVARSLGATYGQGWHYGRPGPLSATGCVDPVLPLLGTTIDPSPRTPFDLFEGHLVGQDAPYEYLLAISLDLEAKAGRLDAPIVVGTFQDADRFTSSTSRRYAALARTSSLVGAIARGLDETPAPGVRGADIAPDDPLRHDWNVVVLGPHFAAALIARDLTGSGPVRSRRYDYTVTHDTQIVTRAMHSLIDRLPPAR